MAQNLAEHARIMTDRMDRGIVKTWLKYGPWLEALNVKSMAGLSREWLVEQELPTVGWRSINEAPLESTGKTERRRTSVGILSSLIDIDKRLLKDPTRVDEAGYQMSMKVRAMGYELAHQLINGSLATDPETFDGLNLLCTELNTRNSRQIIDAAGLDLTTGAAREANGDTLLFNVQDLIMRVEEGCGSKPDFLVMSRNMKLYLSDVIRRLAYMDTTKDSFGRVVDMFDGVKIYTAGFRVVAATATEILGDTFDGTGYTSIFAVKTGDGYTSLVQQGSLDKEHIGPTENGVWDRWKVEHAVGLMVEDNFSIARLKGLDITP